MWSLLTGEGKMAEIKVVIAVLGVVLGMLAAATVVAVALSA